MFHVKQLVDLCPFCHSERSEESHNLNDSLKEFYEFSKGLLWLFK